MLGVPEEDKNVYNHVTNKRYVDTSVRITNEQTKRNITNSRDFTNIPNITKITRIN